MLLAAARYPVCMWKFNACSIFQQQKKKREKTSEEASRRWCFFSALWKLRFIVHALKNMECLIIYSLTLEILWSAESGISIRRGLCWDDHQATSWQPLELNSTTKKTAKINLLNSQKSCSTPFYSAFVLHTWGGVSSRYFVLLSLASCWRKTNVSCNIWFSRYLKIRYLIKLINIIFHILNILLLLCSLTPSFGAQLGSWWEIITLFFFVSVKKHDTSRKLFCCVVFRYWLTRGAVPSSSAETPSRLTRASSS